MNINQPDFDAKNIRIQMEKKEAGMADSRCISEFYKGQLETLIQYVTKDVLMEIVQKWPTCEGGIPVSQSGIVIQKSERVTAEPWPTATYYGKDGKIMEGSFSGLFKEIFGVPVTQDLVCSRTDRGQKCRALSTVENFRNRGMIIKGNGEDPPVPNGDMSSSQVEKMYKDWKDHLIKKGLKIKVFHPEYPGIKDAAHEAERKSDAGQLPVQSPSDPVAGITENEDLTDIYESYYSTAPKEYPGYKAPKR